MDEQKKPRWDLSSVILWVACPLIVVAGVAGVFLDAKQTVAENGGALTPESVLDAIVTEVEEEEVTSFAMELLSEAVAGNEGFRYYRDTVTDVMYLWRGAGYKGGLTVMLEPGTGLPMTYTKYLQMASAAEQEE